MISRIANLAVDAIFTCKLADIDSIHIELT